MQRPGLNVGVAIRAKIAKALQNAKDKCKKETDKAGGRVDPRSSKRKSLEKEFLRSVGDSLGRRSCTAVQGVPSNHPSLQDGHPVCSDGSGPVDAQNGIVQKQVRRKIEREEEARRERLVAKETFKSMCNVPALTWGRPHPFHPQPTPDR